MNLLTIAYKSIRQRWLASMLTGLSVALGVSLMIAVLILNGIVGKMFQQSGSGFDLLVGPKGSPVQLVLSTIYHIDRAIDTLPWSYYKQISETGYVDRAVPVTIGDTTEQGNFPIVGTTPQYFLIEYEPDKKFALKGNGLRGTWDAVIGSHVARQNGWDVGSKFQMVHSGQEDHVHEEFFTVVGVLAPTGTPNDKTAFIHIDGFFALDEHSKPISEAVEREATFYGVPTEEIEARYADDLQEIRSHESESAEEHAHHHHGPVSDLQKSVSAIMLRMKGDEIDRASYTLSLSDKLQRGIQAQGVNPVSVMIQLMQNLVGNIRLAFLYLTSLIIVVSGIGIFVSIYNSMSERKKEIAVMRALGARRQTVFSIILMESLLLCVVGGIAGILLGHAVIFAAAPMISARSGLLINPMAFSWEELIVIPVLIFMATLIGILPGLTAYRTDVAEALQS